MVTFLTLADSADRTFKTDLTSLVASLDDAFAASGATSLPLRFAVLVATSYIVWLAMFEAWVEPWLRARVSRTVGYSVVWRGSGGMLRFWRDASGRRDSGVVALAGATAVLCGAILPSALLPSLLGWIAPGDGAVTAAGYLLAVPMTALFALHVLAARTSDDVARIKE